MRLLIEFYHRNVLENIIAPQGLAPDCVMYFYDPAVVSHYDVFNTYYACKKYTPHLQLELGTYSSKDYKVIDQKLEQYLRQNNTDELCIDLTGGNELTAVASYRWAQELGIPLVYTDPRQQVIKDLADQTRVLGYPTFEFADIIEAAGGRMLGVSDAKYLAKERESLQRMTQKILANVPVWSKTCAYFQKHSVKNRTNNDFYFSGKLDRNNEGYGKFPNEDLMYEFQRQRLIEHLKLNGERIEFDYRNRLSMEYMASFGVWLELHTYYAVLDVPDIADVQTSVKLDWNRMDQQDIVGNEIDVTAIYGSCPVIISCKLSENGTDASALNEIYTVSRRIGGDYAIPILVTYSEIKSRRTGLYMKAKEMGIVVMDKTDIMGPNFTAKLEKSICHYPQSVQNLTGGEYN